MTAVEDYQVQTAALAAGTAAQVAAVFAAVQAGAIVTAGAAGVIASVVSRANATATTLADAYVSAQLESLTGVPTPAIGVPPVDDVERLEVAAQTILDDLDTEHQDQDQDQDQEPNSTGDTETATKAEMRLTRLAESEPLATGQTVAVEVMDAQPKVIGWRRVLDESPCELCQFLYADGRVYKTTTAFQRHPNCNCQPEPVIETKASA